VEDVAAREREFGSQAELSPRARRSLELQRRVGWLLSPFTTFIVFALLRAWLRLTIVQPGAARRAYREIQAADGPLLICANHLTMIDSMIIAWALGSPLFYVRNYAALPWNVPEQRNFASTPLRRALAYVSKCLPIRRGGSRDAVADTLARFRQVVARGDTGLLFPEAGRSRTGRVEVERAAYGVGRIVKSVPDCRVLCVYLRGEAQQGYSDLPARGDRIHVSLAMLEPKSDHAGLRGSRDVARQIAARLAEMEQDHFDAR